MSKAKYLSALPRILAKKSVESVMNELQLLKCIKHEFFINALMAFQDR
jgi:serine/threonine kinase 32